MERSTRQLSQSAKGYWLWVATLASLGCSPERYTDTLFPEGEIREVIVLGNAGEVVIQPGPVLKVERQILGPERSLSISHRVDEGALILENWCRGMLPCSIDVSVQMGEQLPVFVVLDSGDVMIREMNMSEVELARGSVELQEVGDTRIRLAQGQVSGSVLDGSQVDVIVAEGGVNLNLPGGAWSTDIQGSVKNIQGLSNDVDADRDLKLVAHGGQVHAKAATELARR